ncbi:MAG: acetyl-CoA carboxylase biotin carboxylase subunit [Anaerolineae bacterium]
MFKKVLVANRGEIAVRIIRGCHERGLQTVAVYSEADRTALHVRYADEAYLIGPPPARDSYLRIDRILDVAKRSGAEAVHPGYGFLAEREGFAQAVIDAGLIWIGPPPHAIRDMGDKVIARRTVQAAGVPVVPGTSAEESLSDADLLVASEKIGYPLLVKAAAGGGGKGMRTVRSADGLVDALAAARREAKGAFGDDRVYLERLVENARHIEFQILGDEHGNVIHLGERECSIQRRHQKLIEESPSPALNEQLRDRMGSMAVAAAKSVGYTNAGTVEFLLDSKGRFYFLEMNTRLQVEHPVTELVSGVDIVKEQLRIADGRKLRYDQDEIHLKGWALECRITSEDPFNNFLPSTGKIIAVTEPTGPGVRVESAVYEGYEVSLFYDPMIAKLICWGETRAEAILRMRRALAEYRIVGVQTSIPFHQEILDSTNFIAGHFDTQFLEKTFTMPAAAERRHPRTAAIVATLLAHQRRQSALSMNNDSDTVDGWKLYGRQKAVQRW